MTGRNVLVLGAGVYQVPLIQKAQPEGHRVIAASYRATDLGMAMADEAWVIDTTAKEALLESKGRWRQRCDHHRNRCSGPVVRLYL